MTATGFDDLANRRRLPVLVKWVHEHGSTMPLAEIRRIVTARAQSLDAAEHGDYWAESLVDLVVRMGLGRLVREPDGEVVVRFPEPLPSARQIDEAFDRAYFEKRSGVDNLTDLTELARLVRRMLDEHERRVRAVLDEHEARIGALETGKPLAVFARRVSAG